jgi:hypothetical protein
MDKTTQTTRNVEDTMEGKLSVTFSSNASLQAFCQRTFANFDPKLHDIIAIRLYYSEEIILTLYALDKERNKEEKEPGTLQVRKFKVIKPSLHTVASLIREFNFTITNGNYPLDQIEVINK